MSELSAESVQLAVRLSGHDFCEKWRQRGMAVCECCQHAAAVIDEELQLPQRNAALLLARALVDSEDWQACDPSTFSPDIVDQLREALTRIKK